MLTALILSACAGQASIPQPDWSVAERPDTSEAEEAQPQELPLLCEIPRSGQWSVECWAAFEQYEEIAQTNYDKALLVYAALGKTEAAYDTLINAGKLQQQLTLLREEMLQEERRQRQYDNLFHRTIIALGLLAAGVN